MKNKSALQSLIVLAGKNLQENPSTVAESLLDGLRALETEHSALLAVVEAVKPFYCVLSRHEKALSESIEHLNSITKG